MSEISQQQWSEAVKHAKYYLDLYREIPTGFFGAALINRMIIRYETGERTKELYQDMMNVE